MRLNRLTAVLLMFIIILTGCKINPKIDNTNSKPATDKLDEDIVYGEIKWTDIADRWQSNGFSAMQMVDEIKEKKYVPAVATDAVATIFATTTKLKGNADFSQLAKDLETQRLQYISILTIEGKPKPFENFKKLSTDLASCLDDLGTSFLDTGVKTQTLLETPEDQVDFTAINEVFELWNILNKKAEGRPIGEYAKFIQGNLAMSIFGSADSPIYTDDGKLKPGFLDSLKNYESQNPDSSFNDLLVWLLEAYSKNNNAYTPEINRAAQTIYLFGTDRDLWKPEYVTQTNGNETGIYYTFTTAPYGSETTINQLTKQAETDLKASLGYSGAKGESFNFSESVGTANDMLLSLMFYGEYRNSKGQKMSLKPAN